MLKAGLKRKKFYLLVAVIILFLAAEFFGEYFSFYDNNLRAYFLDVGQGDSFLIKTPANKIILIDGGPDNTVIYKLGKYLPWWVRKIDLVVLTHPHSDHLVGLLEVARRYDIGKVMMTGVLHTIPEYFAWLEIIDEKNIEILKAPIADNINLDPSLKIEYLFPNSDWYGQSVENLNNSSIVLRIVYGQNSFLFTGDLEADMQSQLLDLDIESEVLKVPHQGSADSLNKEFLEIVKPKIAVIPVGKNNYGHPSPRAVNFLKRAGVKVFTTQDNGDIIITANTVGLDIKTQK